MPLSGETSTAASDAEIRRIKIAYARRRESVATDTYSLLNPVVTCIVQERQRRTVALLHRCGISSLADVKILDVGCGTGAWLRDFIAWGATPGNLTGIDLLPERLDHTRQLTPTAVTLVCGSAHQLPFANPRFDIVVQSTVFTSVLHASMKANIASEMLRVLKPGGVILWYDFFVNNPRNADVRGVGRREIHQLFPGCAIELHRITVAPPIARMVGRGPAMLYNALAALRLLNTHYLASIRKGGTDSRRAPVRRSADTPEIVSSAQHTAA